MATNRWGNKCVAFSSIFLAQNRSSISQPSRQFFISIKILFNWKKVCSCKIVILIQKSWTPISSYNSPIKDFPSLLRNHLLSNNQALLPLPLILFLPFFCHSAFLLCSLLSLHIPLFNQSLIFYFTKL